MATPSSSDNLMETLVSLCKRRGIIYASSGDDFAAAARKATVELRDQINSFRK